jgi:hypothetical protein
MDFNVYFLFLLIILISVYGLYHVYSNTKKDKYAAIFDYITAISTAILALSVIGTFIEIQRTNHLSNIKNYTEISDNIFDEIIELFLKNKDMDYLYNNIFLQIPIENNKNRNITKEHEFALIIFSKFSKVLELINEKQISKDSYITIRIYRMMDIFMKSEIMQHYWIIYKKQFNPILTIQFMNKRYGL